MTDPLDVCACGDYRRQHASGTGRCLLGDLCTPYGCRQFRLFRAAALGNTPASEIASSRSLPDRELGPGRPTNPVKEEPS